MLISNHKTDEPGANKKKHRASQMKWQSCWMNLLKTKHILHRLHVNAIKTKCKSAFMKFLFCPVLTKRHIRVLWIEQNVCQQQKWSEKIHFSQLKYRLCVFLTKHIWISSWNENHSWISFELFRNYEKELICIENYSNRSFNWFHDAFVCVCFAPNRK